MWADNETAIDLLGFDYLVDTLEVVLTEPRLLPVTVGVLGDWGSGKTSLLRMVAERLEDAPDDSVSEYVVVQFSPWRYEAYEDVKAALMDAVLTALGVRVPDADQEKSGKLRRLRRLVARMMVGPAKAGKTLAPAIGGAIAAHQGLPPALGTAAGSAFVAGADAIAAQADADPSAESPAPTVIESVSDFRDEFEALLESLDDVAAVVVLIDDLDRCLDDTVVDVFEAIRLFLQVSSTAFVIAANREIVQAAVERRYPAAREGDASLGKDYLEKIVQIEVTVPPLAEPEAETYLNLLFADLRLPDDEMALIREAATAHRRQGQFAVAMNYGIAKDVLDDVSPELQSDFTIANRIAPTLSRGLRGNPRQLKRFLNTMLIRIATAQRRSTTLDPSILAKLMILEQSATDFQQLFLWQLAQDGAPEELVAAEAASASGDLGSDTTPELNTWFASQAVRSWLALEPPLAGTPLGEYFFYSRDRLSPAAPGSRLTADLQALLSRLQLPVTAQRRGGVDVAAELSAEEYTPLYEALLDRAGRRPDGHAMKSATELTAKVPTSWPAFVATLATIPPKDVPSSLVTTVIALGGSRAEVKGLIDQWAASDVTRLKNAITEAKKPPT